MTASADENDVGVHPQADDPEEHRPNDETPPTWEKQETKDELDGNVSGDGNIKSDDIGVETERAALDNASQEVLDPERSEKPTDSSGELASSEQDKPFVKDDNAVAENSAEGDIDRERQDDKTDGPAGDRTNASRDQSNAEVPVNGQPEDGRPDAGPEWSAEAPAKNSAVGHSMDTKVNLFVRNVAKHVSEEQLVNLFSQVGLQFFFSLENDSSCLQTVLPSSMPYDAVFGDA